MCRGWIDDDMVWELPRDERPSHVCNPWVWIPDIPITDVVVQIQTVDDLMDHLRTIPRYDCTASATRAAALAASPLGLRSVCARVTVRPAFIYRPQWAFDCLCL